MVVGFGGNNGKSAVVWRVVAKFGANNGKNAFVGSVVAGFGGNNGRNAVVGRIGRPKRPAIDAGGGPESRASKQITER
ncbi:hypothetical protein [Paenibacillus jilunlii]|uniref:hypothetical protein n=1 Tax=Paenibacillus jilunlii TaxID=682956 RepID=UPI0014717CB2|nr:hypothetical protein [Paenibacillus jilunlii]